MAIERIRIKPKPQRVRITRPAVTRPRHDGLTILDACADPMLFAPWFKDRDTWAAWFVFLAALFALPLSTEQLVTYRQCTGRTDPPSEVAREAWLICGRRAGKSFMLALCAVFLACFHSYREYLSPGERGTILVLAADRKQARIILRYVRALLNNIPMLKNMIEREVSDGFDLTNAITIEIGTSSFKATRGYTIVAALCDEIAFWPTDDTAAEPDFEVLNAIRPGMSTIPTAMLLCASSPYARRGALWDSYRKHFGKDHDPILAWQAATRTMNPSVSQAFIDAAFERDPASASAEYGAEFRGDIDSYVSRECVEACTSIGVFERPYLELQRHSAFLDPAGGSGKDSFTCAIAHREGDGAVLDVIREYKPPFSPELVIAELATLLKSYGISKVLGDRFAGEWVREPLRKLGVSYDPSAKPKSDLYRDFLPLLNSGLVDLLDHPKLQTQLIGLERRTARSGKDSIDHPPNGHDDVCNAVAGVITHLNAKRYRFDSSYRWATGETEEDEETTRAHWRASRMNDYIFSAGGLIR